MKMLIVEHAGKLAENEEAPGCTVCCRLSDRIHKRDGTWSWVVCVAGVLSNVIILGNAFTFGVVFPTLLDEFHEGKVKTGKVNHFIPSQLINICLLLLLSIQNMVFYL